MSKYYLPVRYTDEPTFDNLIQDYRNLYKEGEDEDIFYENFYHHTDTLRNILVGKYGDDYIYINTDNWLSKQVEIEVTARIYNRSLISTMISYLVRNAQDYCIIIVFYGIDSFNVDESREAEIGGTYIGRMLMSLRGVLIEKSVADFLGIVGKTYFIESSE